MANAFLGTVIPTFKYTVLLILYLDENQILYSISLSIATTFSPMPTFNANSEWPSFVMS